MIEENYVKGKIDMLGQRRIHMNTRMIITVATVVMGALLALLMASQPAAAAEETNTANTLKVSPVRSDIEVKPGQSRVVQTTVTNLTNAPVTVRPVQNDFVAGDERGTPALILDEKEFAPAHSLKRFMRPLNEITIPANEAKTVNVVIAVPSNAKAGGYFGAVRFAPSTPDDGGQVNLSASVASLMLLTVPGEVIEKLDITDFNVQQNGKSGTFFTNPDNLQITSRFMNDGGVQVGPFGKVSVKKGDKVVYEADFNNKDPRDVTLPGSARRWEVPLKDISSFGKHTVSATYTYGQKNQTIEVEKSFWVIPWAVIIGAIVGLLLLIGVVVSIVLNMRKRGSKRSRIPRRG